MLDFTVLNTKFTSRYLTCDGALSVPVSPAHFNAVDPALALGPASLSVDGYSAEVIGQPHVITSPKKALVYLGKDTRYKLQLSNGNNYLVMARIEIDGAHIGLYSYW